MFKSFLLVVILINSSVKSTDWCKYVSKNGIYDGLGIYHRMNGSVDKHIMFNRLGDEWEFKVRKHGYQSFDIEMIESEMKTYDSTHIVNRWSTYRLPSTDLARYCECELRSNPGKPDFTLKAYGSRRREEEFNDKVFGNRVIMKAKPYSTAGDQAQYVLMFNKSDHIEEYDPIIVDGCEKRVYVCAKYQGFNDFPNIAGCLDQPKFVRQMNASIFKTIEGVIDFNFGNKFEDSGHMLLLNINGRPKYCFTIEGKGISNECNSTDKMRFLFGECFPTPLDIPTTVNTTETTVKEEPNNSKTWILIIVIIVIVIIAIIIAIFCCLKRKRKMKKYSVSQSSQSSKSSKSKGKGSVSAQLAKMDGKYQIMKFKSET